MSKAQSYWRWNSEAGTFTYGNWGGLRWADGRYIPPCQNINEAKDPPYVDDLDGLFRIHDKAYEAAKDAWKLSQRTNADHENFWEF